MSDCCTPPPPGNGRDRDALRRSLLKMTPLHETPVPSCCVPVVKKPVASCCCGPQPEAEAGESCCGGKKGRPDFLLWGSLAVFLAGLVVRFAVPGAPEWLHVFGQTCYEMLARSWWGILFGILSVAVIGRFPQELVTAILGRGGSMSGLVRAVGAGVLLDLCNHGILMVGMSLYKRGASLGQTLAFLIASPWNSLSLTLILAALIGWKWMLLFIGLSMLLALVTGWIVDRLVDAGKIPPNPNAASMTTGAGIGSSVAELFRSLKPGRENYVRLVREGIAGSEMVLRWILFGFILTGALRAFVPEMMFQHYFGPSTAGLFLTMVATTLMEVCSCGSSPIAADLITRAGAPGNAFVFLMGGAATDYTGIMSLRQATGSWKATLALPLITTPQVLLVGWLINHFSR